jgi:hypothetical protein
MASPEGLEPEVSTGPGVLLIAPYGTALPDELSDYPATLDPDFVEVGFTTSGHEFVFSSEKQEIKVAERLRPIRYQAGSTSATWTFTMAQYSPSNIALAIPGATVTTTVGGAIKVTLPKTAGTNRYSLVHVSESGLVMHVLAKCLLSMTGSSTFGGVDSADPTGITVEASIEENSSGDDAYILFDESVYATTP